MLQEMRHPNIILFMGVVLEPAAVVTGEWVLVPGGARLLRLRLLAGCSMQP